jgi:predicted TIM-barrel fold metal-dependent hydrolase
MAELVAAHPGRFGGFAAMPLPDVDAALAEIDYALDTLGLDGVGLFTNYGHTYLGDPAFEPVLAELERRGVVAFVHPAAPADPSPVDLPASVCEFPFATTRMVGQLLYNRVFERYPGLRLILPHAGGTVPYLAERLTFAPVIRPSMEDTAPADPLGSLRTQYYDLAMSGNSCTLPALRAFVGSSQILVGTDFPFMPAWSSTHNGEQLLSSGGFTDAELSFVVRQNAEALFPRLAHDR